MKKNIKPLSDCPACLSTKSKVILRKSEHIFSRCLVCGLEYCNTKSSNAYKIYQRYYSGQNVHLNLEKATGLAKNILRSKLRNFPINFDRTVPRFLDVGCGGGHFVLAAQHIGFDALGTDVDHVAIKRLKKLGLKVKFGSLPGIKLKQDSFDVIKLMHVLEHVHNPYEMANECVRLLKQGGLLWIDVPNQSSLIAKGKKLLSRIGIRRDYGFIQPPLHVNGFGPLSLSNLLLSVGCSIYSSYRSSPIDKNTYPTTPLDYSQNPKYIIYSLLYSLAWKAGDSPYISMMAIKN